MKAIARWNWILAALGSVILLAGCATTQTASQPWRNAVPRGEASSERQLTVVESSGGRQLSPEEIAQLHQAVSEFLQSQGFMSFKGDYYVRVDFAPKNPGDPAAWVIVKLTNVVTSTYTLLAAYPAIGSDDYYPGDYVYGYGFTNSYSPYGYYDSSGYYPGNDHRSFGPATPRRPEHNKSPDRWPGSTDKTPGGTHTRVDGRDGHNDGTPGRDYHPTNVNYTPRPKDSGGSHDRGTRDRTPPPANNGGNQDHGSRSTPTHSSGSDSPRNSGVREYAPRSYESGGTRSLDYTPPVRSESSNSSSYRDSSSSSSSSSAPASYSQPSYKNESSSEPVSSGGIPLK